MQKKNCWMVLNVDSTIAQSSERSHFSPDGSTMLADYWCDYKCGFRGLFKYYLHPWLIGDAVYVPKNIRKYEGARTQEGRLKVFIEKAGKWRSVVCEENLLVINGFYWNMHFYLIYLVEGKWKRFMPFIRRQAISEIEKNRVITISTYFLSKISISLNELSCAIHLWMVFVFCLNVF